MKKLTFLFLGLISLNFACSDKPANETSAIEKDNRMSVHPMAINAQTVQGTTTTFGILESAEAVQINVEFSAIVKKVLVDEGQRVIKNQSLAILSTDKLELQKEQTLQNISQAQSKLASAYANFQRMQQLAEQQTISKQQLEDGELNVASAKALVKQLEAQLKLIQRDINNSVVKSPVDGIVSQRMVEVGMALSPMQAILTLEADGVLRVATYISESELPFMQTGNSATITTAVGNFSSTIYSISATADASTGNFEIKLVLENSQGLLRPGMTAKVELQTTPIEDQLIIPEDALSYYKGRHVVYVVSEGIAERRQVNISLGFEDTLLVSSGLQNGEVIATRFVNLLSDGSLVK